ncbi:hypothetical protein QE152_g27839 [Popillia japonica]|uniref:Polyprotein n=1 Tax=Popillia japonica TaxID=7064 RepID=A0AAW1JK29_POPJA
MCAVSNCLGLHITQHENEDISLDQSSYINDILKRFKMSECTPKSTPSDTNVKLSLSMCPQNDEDRKEVLKIPYQEAVGALLYLSQGTRPDITFAVNDVSRFNSNFGIQHWKAVKRIIRYLKTTIDFRLVYSKTGNQYLHGFSDADWASETISGGHIPDTCFECGNQYLHGFSDADWASETISGELELHECKSLLLKTVVEFQLRSTYPNIIIKYFYRQSTQKEEEMDKLKPKYNLSNRNDVQELIALLEAGDLSDIELGAGDSEEEDEIVMNQIPLNGYG